MSTQTVYLEFDQGVQFAGRERVLRQESVHQEGADRHFTGKFLEWHERGQIVSRKLFAGRPSPPLWPRDEAKMRKVILTALLHRITSGGHGVQRRMVQADLDKLPDDQARLKHLTNLDRQREPALLAVLDRMCREFVELKRSAGDAAPADQRLRTLQREIRTYDSQLCLLRAGLAQKLATMIHLHLRVGYDSVWTSQELGAGVSPQCVRQWSHRLQKIALELGFE